MAKRKGSSKSFGLLDIGGGVDAISDVPGLAGALNGKSDIGHTHDATHITTGTMDTSRLGSGSANASTWLRGDKTWGAVPSGQTFPIPLESFGSVATDQAFTDTLQLAVNSKEFILLPAGIYTLQQPISYETLRLVGRGGMEITGVPKSEVRGATSLGEEAMFHRPNWYLTSDDVRIGTESPSNSGVGSHLILENIRFRSLSTLGCILDLYNLGPMSTIKSCAFHTRFRGITAVGTFGFSIYDSVFTQTVEPSIALDDSMLRKAWCCRLSSHASIHECNFQGGMTGIVASGPGIRVLGGRIESMHYGIILGSKNLHQDQFGSQWPFTGLVEYVTTESVRRHVTCDWVQSGSFLHGLNLTGWVAPQPDGTTGECEYAISLNNFHSNSKMARISVTGDFSQAGIVGSLSTPNEQILITNTGSGGSWIAS